ncbi:DUF4389 domain-containing protein [Actinokineospora xionganensis]|uniref:DUF4389 domain-containing protein n=1 Tax=Actinokineospora xionganensis TaxID=2684470 RepID=A0ABR7KZG7_9PSEU|nr:DUF4389 domain-containing protein [Actinokineospora xionganensis]MBC6445826.1 DUF4389 domain-containing protein [Actinokineospora xionganensis]
MRNDSATPGDTATTGVTSPPPSYPVRVDGRLDQPLSRWLWLVKWLLLVPHYVVLIPLWLGFVVATAIAFFAILITGRYPPALFAYTVGVLRWSWRVHYYGYAGLGTDRYPPFTLADVPDYPARLRIAYPDHLSRGLVLVKWWLLALPHYLIAALFAGGGLWLGASDNDAGFDWAAGGLIGVLVVVAGVILLFSGRYPRELHEFVVGLDRWVLRVAAYGALMTDRYPPFRIDLGATESAAPVDDTPPPVPPVWTPGRTAAMVAGALLALVAIGPLTAGAGVLWINATQRDASGYVATSTIDLRTPGHAITEEAVAIRDDLDWLSGAVGDVRLIVTASDPATPVFVGVGPEPDVRRYLDGVARAEVGQADSSELITVELPGGPPPTPPGEQSFWLASSEGAGARNLDWRLHDGVWTVVAMNADGSAPVSIDARAAARLPGLPWIGGVLLALSGLLLAAAAALVIGSLRRASPTRTN